MFFPSRERPARTNNQSAAWYSLQLLLFLRPGRFLTARGRSIRQDTPARPLRHPNITLPWETPARLPLLVPVLGKLPSRACRMLLKGSIRRNNRFLGSAEKGAAAYFSLSGYPYLSYILVSRSIDLFSRDIVTGAVYETF